MARKDTTADELFEKERASLDDQLVKQASRWASDHGYPSPQRLEELASEGSFASLESLRELADEFNIVYDRTTSPKQLADKINWAMMKGSEAS